MSDNSNAGDDKQGQAPVEDRLAALADAVDEDGDRITTLTPDMLRQLFGNSGAAVAPATGAAGNMTGMDAFAAAFGGRETSASAEEGAADAAAAAAAADADAPADIEDDGKDGPWRNRQPVAADPETGRNTRKIVCPFCAKSVILLAGAAVLVEKDIFLHYPRASDETQGEVYSQHFKVTSKMDFENVGVRRPAREDADFKYLTCCDCDRGPIGLTYTADNNKVFYVAHARVLYR